MVEKATEFISPNWWVAGEAKAEASDVIDLQRMKRPGLKLGKQKKQGQVQEEADQFALGCAEFQVLVQY